MFSAETFHYEVSFLLIHFASSFFAFCRVPDGFFVIACQDGKTIALFLSNKNRML